MNSSKYTVRGASTSLGQMKMQIMEHESWVNTEIQEVMSQDIRRMNFFLRWAPPAGCHLVNFFNISQVQDEGLGVALLSNLEASMKLKPT